MSRMFGTDGVRGIAGTELDCRLAFDLGRAGAHVLTSGTRKPRILVGRDTRVSGTMLEAALCAGICSVGAQAVTVGVVPTPAVAYLTRIHHFDAGVMISASHNPMEYNGIKFFSGSGYKLDDAVEDEIEAIITGGCVNLEQPTGIDVGTVTAMNRGAEEYIDYLVSLNRVDLSGLKVSIDCANGAVSYIAPEFLRRLGVEVISVYDTPNGHNINAGCGSTHMAALTGIVKDTGSDFGLAFDGDADRLLAVDERGSIVDGDKIMMICARDLKDQGKLIKDTLVVTVMSNLGLSVAARELGIALEKTKVGDRYVLECMREKGYCLGGEQSGHVIFLEDNTTGDGLLTALRLMESYKKNGCQMSELAGIMKEMPQVLVNVKVPGSKKQSIAEDARIAEQIARIEAFYGEAGRVLVRPSGTEDLVRIMIEGPDAQQIERDAENLAGLIADSIV